MASFKMSYAYFEKFQCLAILFREKSIVLQYVITKADPGPSFLLIVEFSTSIKQTRINQTGVCTCTYDLAGNELVIE